MNKERLVIKNFGPIKSVDLELGKMTILIGEQATGKSTIAKVLAVCRYFSYIVNYSISIEKLSEFSNNEQFRDGLLEWDIESFLYENSEFIYENFLYKFEFKNKLIVEYESVAGINDYKKEFFECHTKIKSNHPEFDNLLAQLDDLRNEESLQKKTAVEFFQFIGWSPNENFYRLNVKKIMDNPLYIPTERVLQGSNMLIAKALEYEVIKIDRIVKSYSKETTIEPLSLTYKNQKGLGYVKKEKSTEYHTLHNGASGYQSTIPIVLAIKKYNEIDKRQRTFVIEEPELNLFPSAQKKLVEFIVESIYKYKKNRFLLPTHSPYIVSSLNNLMVAYRIGQKHNKKVNDIIKEKYWINPKDVEAYRLFYDEKEKGVMKENLILEDLQEISIDYLDGISSEINQIWDKLLQIEDGD